MRLGFRHMHTSWLSGAVERTNAGAPAQAKVEAMAQPEQQAAIALAGLSRLLGHAPAPADLRKEWEDARVRAAGVAKGRARAGVEQAAIPRSAAPAYTAPLQGLEDDDDGAPSTESGDWVDVAPAEVRWPRQRQGGRRHTSATATSTPSRSPGIFVRRWWTSTA